MFTTSRIAQLAGRRLALGLFALGLLIALAAGQSTARADFGFAPGSVHADAYDANGGFDTRAGAHPFAASTQFTFNTVYDSNGREVPDEQLKDIEADLPVGFLGDPQAGPTCPYTMLLTPNTCPPSSQVGKVELDWDALLGQRETWTFPLYNMEPSNGHVAELAFKTSYTQSVLVASVRPDDGGIRIRTSNVSQAARVYGLKVTLWGVPGDDAHKPERGGACTPTLGCDYGLWGGPAPFSTNVRPFVTNPATCDGRAKTTFRARSWQHPDRWVSATAVAQADPVGCEHVDFDPSVRAQPGTTEPDSPTGLTVDLGLRQTDGPTELTTSPMRDAVITFPEGLTINPSSADGLEACTDEQLAPTSEAPPACPEASMVATATVDTPVLAKPLEGAVYVGRQTPDQLLRLFLVLNGQGVLVKIPGKVDLDPATGRMTATFQRNPQLPFTNLRLRFKSGSRAPLATPLECGPKVVQARLTPWSGGAAASLTDRFTIACPATPPGFAPRVTAGTTESAGGASSPLIITIERADGEQYVDGVTVSLPTGLLGRLRGVPVCAEGLAASGACPAGTRVGSATIGSGAGAPFFLRDQPVYLAGPYKGAPYSLAVAARVIAGPLDLGTVVVRQGIHIDPIDAHVTVVSDPLPTIVKGIPLRLRSIRIAMDRPGFMVNPTSCAAKRITGSVASTGGRSVALDVPFQAADCAGLALTPKLSMSLSGKGQTRDGAHPALSATLTQPVGGQANLKRVKVTLPASLALDPEQAQSDALCSFAEGSKTIPNCPASSVVGRATAVTPILDEPLTGPVYFVKNQRIDPKTGRAKATLPKLAIPLVGQNGVRLTLTATSDVDDDGRLVTTFDKIPDAAVSSFKLDINGGKKGILVVTGGSKTDICAASQVTEQEIDGQNNKAADADVYLQTPSCLLKVLSKKVGARSVAVKVGGLGAGKVTVSGPGVRKTTKTIAKSTVATITAKRTKGAVGKVTVTFDPAGPAKAKKTSK
ncbi:MAG TPA: hypothetical protein VFG42_24235 [Baekduia sp.]|uniref:hypothetical protein n=1 Tax=Baekduia sp. TaxID=2600305 RepID=UPI002D79B331|nr:hypothetical protein [Baekduia sp.]HET6509924.1 hypothetical protein [Baekduia sp.]